MWISYTHSLPCGTSHKENVQFLFYLLGFNSDTRRTFALFWLKCRYFYQIELDFGYKICAVLCNIYVRDKEEANGQNMSGKWIYNFKVNVDWCSFAKVVLHKNSKGLTRTHGQSVELGNCEFFIMAGRGYLHFTVHSNLAHLLFCPKAIVNALQKCSLFSFLLHFLLSFSPLYHKSKNATDFNWTSIVTIQVFNLKRFSFPYEISTHILSSNSRLLILIYFLTTIISIW